MEVKETINYFFLSSFLLKKFFIFNIDPIKKDAFPKNIFFFKTSSRRRETEGDCSPHSFH